MNVNLTKPVLQVNVTSFPRVSGDLFCVHCSTSRKVRCCNLWCTISWNLSQPPVHIRLGSTFQNDISLYLINSHNSVYAVTGKGYVFFDYECKNQINTNQIKCIIKLVKLHFIHEFWMYGSKMFHQKKRLFKNKVHLPHFTKNGSAIWLSKLKYHQ